MSARLGAPPPHSHELGHAPGPLAAWHTPSSAARNEINIYVNYDSGAQYPHHRPLVPYCAPPFVLISLRTFEPRYPFPSVRVLERIIELGAMGQRAWSAIVGGEKEKGA